MSIKSPCTLYDAYIFDLDGTVYLGDSLLPTAGETIAQLKDLGKRILFLSNNPTRSRADYAQKLTHLGLLVSPEEVLNSSYVMVDFLRQRAPEAKLFVVGEMALRRELEAAGFQLSEDASAIDAVIASFDRTFTYHKLQIAFDAIRNGARFYATNSDRYCPVPGGGQPDAAAMIAAIEACTDIGVEAVVGKPSRHMIAAISSLIDHPADRCLLVGDRLETDIMMGIEAGMDTALTLTGATDQRAAAESSIRPSYVINQLGDLLPEPDNADAVSLRGAESS